MTWQTSYYHYDGLGSTLCLTDENGEITDSYAYTAFGEEVDTGAANPTPNPFRYVGREGYYRDADPGDYYVRARTYHPRTARFLSQDAMGLFSDANLYVYADNRVVNVADASGNRPANIDWQGSLRMLRTIGIAADYLSTGGRISTMVDVCTKGYSCRGRTWIPPCNQRVYWEPGMCCPGNESCGCTCTQTQWGDRLGNDPAKIKQMIQNALRWYPAFVGKAGIYGLYQQSAVKAASAAIDEGSNFQGLSGQALTQLKLSLGSDVWPLGQVGILVGAAPEELHGVGGLVCRGTDIGNPNPVPGVTRYVFLNSAMNGCNLISILFHELLHARSNNPVAEMLVPKYEILAYNMTCAVLAAEECPAKGPGSEEFQTRVSNCVANYMKENDAVRTSPAGSKLRADYASVCRKIFRGRNKESIEVYTPPGR